MKSTQSKVYSVAEICDGKIKLIDESGGIMYFDCSLIKYPIAEGDMLRFDPQSAAAPDKDLTEQKRKSIKEKHNRLKRKR